MNKILKTAVWRHQRASKAARLDLRDTNKDELAIFLSGYSYRKLHPRAFISLSGRRWTLKFMAMKSARMWRAMSHREMNPTFCSAFDFKRFAKLSGEGARR